MLRVFQVIGRLGIAAVFGILATIAAPDAKAKEILKICLEEESPPYSYKFGKNIGGFDYQLAQELAARLGRDLTIQWFETENDEENIPKLEANALLSAPLCHLVGGYPMLKAALGSAPQGKFTLPDHEGQKRSERLKLIDLGVVVPSLPYNRSVYGVIVGPAVTGDITSLDDIAGLRIMSEVATLASAILMRHDGGRLVDHTSHVSPLEGLFKQMNAGKADATLVEVHRFERFRFRNPDTKLRFSGYIVPIGINFGFAALDTSNALLDDVNRVLEELAAAGTLEDFAAANHMTLFEPQKPFVTERIVLP